MPSERYIWGRGFANGDRYNGEVIEGNIKDGNGEFFWAATGAKYVGMWSRDKPHGKGKYTIPGETGYTYEGDFVNGERSGNGICIFSNGRRYEGEWLGDKMHGHGSLYGAQGIDDFLEYTGPFVNGERSGANGECRYANENKYKGSWLHDKRHGRGELQLQKTSSTPGYTPRMGDPHVVLYKGEFKNDAPGGRGEFLYSDGSSYQGECAGFSRHGEGVHHTVKGDTYKGTFQFDRRCGKGVLYNKSGKYNGEWRDDLLEGHLVFRGDAAAPVATGLVFYEGSCVGGEMEGNDVVAEYRDGSSYRGAMVAGKPNGMGTLEKKRMTIPGVGEFMLRYEGEFVGGVPKGSGTGTFTLVKSDPRPAPPPPISEEVRGFIPRFDISGQYTGMWANGMPNGDGEWQWEDEQSYRGTLKTGIPHGSGVFNTPGVVYEGTFALGLPDGHGKISWKGSAGEDKYEGTWKEGHLDGEGTLTLHDGSTYSGGWKSGIKEGRGVDSVVRNYHYSGELKDGKRHGKGTIRMLQEDFTYEGEFAMGDITGTGKMTLDDGTVMIGGFVNGKPDGHMEVRLPAQGVFQGEFKNGVVSGTGTLLYPNGDKYEGEFADSGKPLPLRHGRGVYTFLEGNVLECTWKRNVLHGDGVYTTSTGDRSTRSYVDGVLRTPSPQSADLVLSDKECPTASSEEVLKQEQQQLDRKRVVSICRSLPRRSVVDNAVQRSVAQRVKSAGATISLAATPTTTGANFSTITAPKLVNPQCAAVALNSPLSTSISHSSGASVKIFAAVPRVSCGIATGAARGESDVGSRASLGPFYSRFQEGKGGQAGGTAGFEGPRRARPDARVPAAGESREPAQRAPATPESREGEIHSLTEELRRVNEQIWQGLFMPGSPVTVGNGEPTSTETSRLDHLHSLQLERRDIVKRLNGIIR